MASRRVCMCVFYRKLALSHDHRKKIMLEEFLFMTVMQLWFLTAQKYQKDLCVCVYKVIIKMK